MANRWPWVIVGCEEKDWPLTVALVTCDVAAGLVANDKARLANSARIAAMDCGESFSA